MSCVLCFLVTIAPFKIIVVCVQYNMTFLRTAYGLKPPKYCVQKGGLPSLMAYLNMFSVMAIDIFSSLSSTNAMVTNHLRAPCSVFSPKIVDNYLFYKCFVRCLVKCRYYLKFHDTRTAFCRAIKGIK